MAQTPRDENAPMTQDATARSDDELVVVATRRPAGARGLRQHYRSPAHMRAAAAVLRNPDPRELKRLGLPLTERWEATADEVEREASCWESERTIDST